MPAIGQLTRPCTYDGGSFGRQADKNEYMSEDLNHFSVKGPADAVFDPASLLPVGDGDGESSAGAASGMVTE